MASAAYPLLRPRRRHRAWRLPLAPRWLALAPRWLALGVLALVLGTAGALLLRQGSRPDPARLLADARTTIAAGNYHAALRNARAAATAMPRSVAAHLLSTRAALLLDEGLAADAALDRAEAAGARPRTLLAWRAHARLLQGDVDGALAFAAKAPASAYAARIRARAQAATGHTAAATLALADLAARHPRDGAVWTDLARIRLTAGDIGGAAAAAGQAVSAAPADPAALTLAGEIVRTRFGIAAGLPWFAAALRRDAYYHPALIELAASQGELGRHAAMLATTRRALFARPGSPQALYLQAVLAGRAGQTDLARRLLQLTGGAVEGVPGTLLLDGALDFRRGDVDQAAAKWRRLAEAQPLNVAARRLLALALFRSGAMADSLEVLRPMVMRADADAYTLRLAARVLERVGDRANAAVLLDRAAAGAGIATPFAPDSSVGALAAAAADAPTDPTYQVGLIRGLIATGDGPAAVARGRALAGASPGAPAAQLALGDALVAAGRQGQAAATYARAADLAFDAPTMLRLVDALGRTGDARRVAVALGLYRQQNPRSVEARRMLGHLQVVSGDGATAIRTLEPLRVAGGGRDAGLLADLSRAHARGGQARLARRYGAMAYALAPMNPAVLAAFAEALEAAGDPRGAAQIAAKARAVAVGVSAS